jgi:hypothetical protein
LLIAHCPSLKTQGAVAQLGERLLCKQEATGSIPVSSTKFFNAEKRQMKIMDSITSLGGLLVPICAIIIGGVIAIVGMIHRHDERIAKIERGINPDAPWPQQK